MKKVKIVKEIDCTKLVKLEEIVFIRTDTLKQIRYILRDICDSLCKKDHECGGCRATAVLKMVEKDLKELNKKGG